MAGATEKSDVWSVGCTVIELLTGAPPYAELPQVPALFRIVQDNHPPLPALADTDDDLFDFLMICFNRDPQRRASASALSLHAWLDLDSKIARRADQSTGDDLDAAPLSKSCMSRASTRKSGSVGEACNTSFSDKGHTQICPNNETTRTKRQPLHSIGSLPHESGNSTLSWTLHGEYNQKIPPFDTAAAKDDPRSVSPPLDRNGSAATSSSTKRVRPYPVRAVPANSAKEGAPADLVDSKPLVRDAQNKMPLLCPAQGA